MPKTRTSFQPGQSGNPKGTPPKHRALTALLERAGAKTVLVDGKNVSSKRWLAGALWQVITSASVTMPDGRTFDVEPKDWLETVKWLYAHVDGPPRQGAAGTEDDPVHSVGYTPAQFKAEQARRRQEVEGTLDAFETDGASDA